MVSEEPARDRAQTQRWLVGLESPTELLLEAVRRDICVYEEVEALDRVPEGDLPQLVAAVAEHLPGRMADELGQLLLLQVPDLMEEHAGRLTDREPYLWRDQLWEAGRSLVLLPAHHVSFPEQAVAVRAPDSFASLTSPSPTWWPHAPAVGAGRVGGVAEGSCLRCARDLQRVVDLGTFPGADGVTLPREVVACVESSCLWGEQFFTHEGEVPRSLPGHNDYPLAGDPAAPMVLELAVTFHPAPARWQVQDWMLSNSRQNLNRLGGPPSWVQDALYPRCPGCTRPMPFLAQVDGATGFVDGPGWGAWTEGIVYAFWCAGCRVSAVSSQQT